MRFLGPGIAAAFALALIGLAQVFAQSPGVGPNVTNLGAYGPPFVAQGGHWTLGAGAAPTLNAACGTGPVAPVGTDSSFQFKSGTSSNSGCIVTFAQAWNQAPNCSVDGTNAVTFTISPNSIALVGVLDSQIYNIICIGRPGG